PVNKCSWRNGGSWSDGMYEIGHIVYDNAKNKAYFNAPAQKFVIDSTAPTFTLTDDGSPRQPIADGSFVNPAKLGDRDNNGNTIRFTKQSATDTLYVNDKPIFTHGYFNKGTSGQIGAAFKHEGTYTVYTEDLAGNKSETITFTVDSTAPATPTITAPGARTWHKSSPITDTWTKVTQDMNGNPENIDHYQIAYSYDDGHVFGGTNTCPGVSIAGVSGFIGCRDVSSTSRKHAPAANEQGGVTIWVRAVDKAGNAGAWSKSVHYYYDHENPFTDIKITGLNSNNAADGTFTVEGDASDNLSLNRVYVQLVNRENGKRYGGTTINLIPNGINPNGVSAHWSYAYDFAVLGLPDGTYAANVEAVDMAGNTFNPGWTANFTVDATAPVLGSVTAAPNKDGTYTFSGTTDDPASPLVVKLDGTALTGVTVDSNGSWSVTVPKPAAGQHTVTVDSTDAVGNVAQRKSTGFGVLGASTGGGMGGGTAKEPSKPDLKVDPNINRFSVVAQSSPSDSQTLTSTDTNKKDVKGASTDKPNTDTVATTGKADKDSAKTTNKFLGLGWWWLPIIVVVLGLLWILLGRSANRTDTKA
ncbi:MAG TPA: Ig-like domain-containing protein, partial [Candidatus Saccharimonadales bacterium]|nr:Ig-like domain-containing protein [Candidatus Saccharimonadales bacterium]